MKLRQNYRFCNVWINRIAIDNGCALQQLKSLLTTQIAIYQPDCRRFGEIQASIEASNIDLISLVERANRISAILFAQRQQQYQIAAVGAVSHITSFTELSEFKQNYPLFYARWRRSISR